MYCRVVHNYLLSAYSVFYGEVGRWGGGRVVAKTVATHIRSLDVSVCRNKRSKDHTPRAPEAF